MSPAGGAPGSGAGATGAGATGAGATGAGEIGAAGITLAFDQATVDLDALQRSAYAVAAEMTVDIRVSGTEYACTLFPRGKDTTDDELKHRFRVEVNDQILRVRIAKETEPLRNLVFALAFSQTGLVETGEAQ
jgi:His-Xaa-Ser system protein HxsD